MLRKEAEEAAHEEQAAKKKVERKKQDMGAALRDAALKRMVPVEKGNSIFVYIHGGSLLSRLRGA